MMLRSILTAALLFLTCAQPQAWSADTPDADAPRTLSDEEWAALNRGQFGQALPAVQAAADSGNPDALLYLAMMHAVGAGFVIDPEEATKWLQRAADAGNGTAALALLSGDRREDPRAETWKATAADPSTHTTRIPVSLGSVILGRLNYDFQTALRWNRPRARAGDPDALYNLAKYTLFVPQLVGARPGDFPAALEKAAEAGQLQAINEVRLYAELGLLGFDKDPEKARRYEQLAADAGDSNAQRSAGLAWVKGDGVTRDVARGLALLEAAADQGDGDALEELGDLFGIGEHVERDFARSLRYRQRGATLGHVRCMADLAWQLEHGHGTEKNLAAAATWFERAHEQGYHWATYRLGQFLLTGKEGVPTDPARGLELITEAAENGVTTAMEALGAMYHNGDYTEQDDELAFEWMEQAAREGRDSAQHTLGWWLLDGTGIDPDPEEALTWFTFAAEDGHAPSAHMLWAMYSGKHDGPVDLIQATKWRDEAARLGDIGARLSQLGEQLQRGDSAEKREALDALVELAEDHPVAIITYATGLLTNPLLARSPEDQLISRLQAQVDQDFPPAQYALGRLLLRGRSDLPRDLDRGHELLKDSAEAGYVPAQATLYQYYREPGSPLYDEEQATAWHARYADASPDFARLLQHWEPSAPHAPEPLSEEELAARRAKHADRTGDGPPIVVYQCPPVYPFDQRLNDVTGQVIVAFVVNSRGDPVNLEVVSSTDPEFEQPALDAVAKWRFVPGIRNGRTVNTRMQVPIVFNITEE